MYVLFFCFFSGMYIFYVESVLMKIKDNIAMHFAIFESKIKRKKDEVENKVRRSRYYYPSN